MALKRTGWVILKPQLREEVADPLLVVLEDRVETGPPLVLSQGFLSRDQSLRQRWIRSPDPFQANRGSPSWHEELVVDPGQHPVQLAHPLQMLSLAPGDSPVVKSPQLFLPATETFSS